MSHILLIALGVFLTLLTIDNIVYQHVDVHNVRSNDGIRLEYPSELMINRNICHEKYSKRRLKKVSNLTTAPVPPILYSFPGSGNTWVRLLIDYSTGVFSGSMYHDRALFDTLPGERHCNRKVSVIKAHPHLQTFAILNNSKLYTKKCTIGHIQSFSRAILLIRDPFDSIFSEFQRRWSGSHIGGIHKSSFDEQKWVNHCGFLSVKYKETISTENAGVIKVE